jgi:hypothetical protein
MTLQRVVGNTLVGIDTKCRSLYLIGSCCKPFFGACMAFTFTARSILHYYLFLHFLLRTHGLHHAYYFLPAMLDNMPPQLRRDHPAILVASRKLVNSGKPAEDASLNPQKGGEEFLVHSIPWSLMPEQSQKEIDHKSNIAINCHASSVQGALSPCHLVNHLGMKYIKMMQLLNSTKLE